MTTMQKIKEAYEALQKAFEEEGIVPNIDMWVHRGLSETRALQLLATFAEYPEDIEVDRAQHLGGTNWYDLHKWDDRKAKGGIRISIDIPEPTKTKVAK
jgi:hypothetical protein